MKRCVCMFLIALLAVCMTAHADVDLSEMDFDQLVAVREQINIALWNSAEWQEVAVPEGLYQIGVDIPAGHWSIRVAAEHDTLSVTYFDKVDEVGKGVGRGSYVFTQGIASPGFSAFGEINSETVDIDAHDGWYIKLTGAVIFTPYTGKPDFVFN